jgi:hypothetical protein
MKFKRRMAIVMGAVQVMTSIIDSEKIKQICDGVWHDRASILAMRGILSGEAALARAVYWRLCKAGRKPGESIEDCAPFLRELVQQYRDEAV